MNIVTVGRIFAFLLFVCPSPYVVVALGGSASPAMLLGLGMFVWWTFTRMTRSLSAAHTRQPIRIAVYFMIAGVVASMAAAYARVLPLEESQAPLRGLAIALSFSGVCLFFADGLRTRADVEKVVTALVMGASFVAFVGILQFFTGEIIADMLKLPGLGSVNDVVFISERNGLPRVAGTAYHPIEYAIILCAMWPFALRYSVMQWTRRARIFALVPSVVITAALATALSRTTVVAFGAVLVTMWFTWTARRRFRIAVLSVVSVFVLFIVAPQVPRVLIELFTKADEDISITTRTEDYSSASEFIQSRLFFGRGIKTFDPGRYFFLDNQYLLSLIETGVVGTLTLLALFVTAITLARNVRHTAREQSTRELGQCCVAALVAVLLCFATFDTLSFPMISFTTMAIIGIASALWRINRYENGETELEFTWKASRIVERETPVDLTQDHEIEVQRA